MIIIGWGKDSKKISDAGISKCGNCENFSTFEIREVSKKVKLYFIPVAKWDKKFYAVCMTCNAGFQLTENEKDEIIKMALSHPSNALYSEMFNAVDKLFVDYYSENNDLAGWRKHAIIEMLKKGYREDHIASVIDLYNASLLDSVKNKKAVG